MRRDAEARRVRVADVSLCAPLRLRDLSAKTKPWPDREPSSSVKSFRRKGVCPVGSLPGATATADANQDYPAERPDCGGEGESQAQIPALVELVGSVFVRDCRPLIPGPSPPKSGWRESGLLSRTSELWGRREPGRWVCSVFLPSLFISVGLAPISVPDRAPQSPEANGRIHPSIIGNHRFFAWWSGARS